MTALSSGSGIRLDKRVADLCRRRPTANIWSPRATPTDLPKSLQDSLPPLPLRSELAPQPQSSTPGALDGLTPSGCRPRSPLHRCARRSRDVRTDLQRIGRWRAPGTRASLQRVRGIGAEDIANSTGCSASEAALRLPARSTFVSSALASRQRSSIDTQTRILSASFHPRRDRGPNGKRPRTSRTASFLGSSSISSASRIEPCPWSRSRRECDKGSSSHFAGAMLISTRRLHVYGRAIQAGRSEREEPRAARRLTSSRMSSNFSDTCVRRIPAPRKT